REELIGTPALDLIHPDDYDLAAAALATELAGGPVTPVEVRVRHRAGHFLWFEVLANGWLEEPGGTGLVLNLRESTGRHELAVVAAQRAALAGLVSDVSRRALDATLADVTKALPGILAELGTLLAPPMPTSCCSMPLVGWRPTRRAGPPTPTATRPVPSGR